jgi:hypothetical protein
MGVCLVYILTNLPKLLISFPYLFHITSNTTSLDVGFHMGWEQLHVLLSNTFNSSHWQVDIVLTKDDIRTFVDIVIANPTQADLLPWSCAT